MSAPPADFAFFCRSGFLRCQPRGADRSRADGGCASCAARVRFALPVNKTVSGDLTQWKDSRCTIRNSLLSHKVERECKTSTTGSGSTSTRRTTCEDVTYYRFIYNVTKVFDDESKGFAGAHQRASAPARQRRRAATTDESRLCLAQRLTGTTARGPSGRRRRRPARRAPSCRVW